ncbi:MAG TPA: agmatine deiminase family protein [Kofleriaceae bacterium]|jgi:hypothetical protein|nr:agmatine deiminase family protein [Kofleriaceae bacterium]
MRRLLASVIAGFVAALAVVWLAAFARGPRRVTTRLVAEDASAPLSHIAIQYAPASDKVALGVWTQLFAALPARVRVEVEVANARDFDRFVAQMKRARIDHLDRFHAVVVGAPAISTWSRDRFAALVDDDGATHVLAPPMIETHFRARAGDQLAPRAMSRALDGGDPRTAEIVFEGGDLAATPRLVFADANLIGRNVGRGTAGDRASIEDALARHLAQRIVWLGDAVGDVPRHHIMMYMVPLDDETIAVGDERAGAALYALDPAHAPIALDDVEAEAARFDRAAALLTAQGFHVVRVPALVLKGAGSYVTYTNALFDRSDRGPVVYLPTYRQPALDRAARAFYEAHGFEVRPIDVAPIYTLNGSLGCLVNVLAR